MPQNSAAEKPLTASFVAKLRLCPGELRGPDGKDQLYSFAVNPEVPPVEAGYELIQGTELKQISESEFDLTVMAIVHDAQALLKAADDACESNWNTGPLDIYEGTVTLDNLLYEVVLASNASASPVDCGYEIVDQTFPDDGHVIATSDDEDD